MKTENGIRKTLGVIGYVFSGLVLAALVAVATGVLIETIKLETRTQARLFLHRNLLLGFLAFFLLFIIRIHAPSIRPLLLQEGISIQCQRCRQLRLL